MDRDELFGSQKIDFVPFEEMERAFETPTQHQGDYAPKPEPDPDLGDLGHLADPSGDAFHDFVQLADDEPEREPVSPEKARRTGERIARLIDTGIDFTLSNFVAQNGESYRADERDLQDIAEAWGEVSEEHNWNIGPEMTLAILYIMVYGPLVKQALTDRRLSRLEARQDAQVEQVKYLSEQVKYLSAKLQPQPNTPAADGSNPNQNEPAANTASIQP